MYKIGKFLDSCGIIYYFIVIIGRFLKDNICDDFDKY